MVGLGHLGAESALARVSLVNYHGHIVLDTFVAPRERVTDWRTWVSGVREEDILGAPSFEEVQKKVAALTEGKVMVGHAIENDFKVSISLSHNQVMEIRENGMSCNRGKVAIKVRELITGASSESPWTNGAGHAEVQGVERDSKD